MLMQFIVFFVVGLPDRLAIRRILFLLFQSIEIVNIAYLLVCVLLIGMQMFHGVHHRFEVGLLKGILEFLIDVGEATIDYASLRSVYDD